MARWMKIPTSFLLGTFAMIALAMPPCFAGEPLTLVSSLRSVSGEYAEQFKFSVDKSSIKPLRLVPSRTPGWLNACISQCGTKDEIRADVLSLSPEGMALTRNDQGQELINQHAFFLERNELAGAPLSIGRMSLRENAPIITRGVPLRFGVLEVELVDAQGRATSFIVDWVLSPFARDPAFVPKLGRPDIGFFAKYSARVGRDVILRFSTRAFPIPVTVFGSGVSPEALTALNVSIQDWNRLLRDLAPQGVFTQPRIVASSEFFDREPFMGRDFGIVIELAPKPGLTYSGHTVWYSDPETNQNYGARIWMNAPVIVNNAKSILTRCQQAQAGLAYAEPWKSLGNCKLSESAQVFGSFRYGFTHELGHALGLTHNFKGSLQPPTGEVSSSIMEYPNGGADRPAIKLGKYDRDAMVWGYYGRAVAKPMLFCDDDSSDIWDEKFMIKDPQCSGDDRGVDSFSYYERTWIQLIELGLGRSGVPPQYSFEDLKPGLTLSLKAFTQYYAGAEIYGPRLVNFYGPSGRPSNASGIREFILRTIETPICSRDFQERASPEFVVQLKQLVDEQLNQYAHLNLEISCLNR